MHNLMCVSAVVIVYGLRIQLPRYSFIKNCAAALETIYLPPEHSFQCQFIFHIPCSSNIMLTPPDTTMNIVYSCSSQLSSVYSQSSFNIPVGGTPVSMLPTFQW